MVSTPIGRVHVYDAPGTGGLPPIVLLHGITASGASFAPLLARLRRRARRVVAVEYPGHGFSDAPHGTLTLDRLLESVSAALDQIVPEPVILVGNSLGGGVAAYLAIARPDRVAALVLLSPGGAQSKPDDWQMLQQTFRITSRREALAFLARVSHRPSPLAALIAHELIASADRPAVRDLFDTTPAERCVPPVELAALATPILLWWGGSERILPAAHLAWWRTHLPGHAVIEQPEGIGHVPHLDDPSRVAARIAAFAEAAVSAVPRRQDPVTAA
jgi:pimeloyl-ACP methyl ester carboxylesterase